MTSSARPSSEGGIVSPSALAALRLMTSSNLLDCSTGSSAGLAPFRILSLSSGRSRHSSDHIRRKENASRASSGRTLRQIARTSGDPQNASFSAPTMIMPLPDKFPADSAFAHGHGHVPIHGHRGQHRVVGATTCCDAGRARAPRHCCTSDQGASGSSSRPRATVYRGLRTATDALEACVAAQRALQAPQAALRILTRPV